MNKIGKSKVVRASLLLFAIAIVVVGQTQLASWPFYVEISTNGSAGLHQFTVPLEVMGKGRDDLGDLRLFDANNHETPYAIRIRKDVSEEREFGAQVFNEVTVGSATEATIDLGSNPREHNQVQLQTAGTDFRRRVVIEGSDSASQWRTLNADGVIFRFQSAGRTVESNDISYPTSRYRYVRVRVGSDELSDDDPPDIIGVGVKMAVHDQGRLTTWDVMVPSYELNRNQGAHAASWTVDFGSRVPCDRLTLTIADESFYRPFEVEVADDPQNPRLIANGYLSRRAGEEPKPITITFDQEEHVQKLRLQITDYSNPTLTIENIEASAPARELVFQLSQPQSAPLRLYSGNAKIAEPHYDFEKELREKLKTTPSEASVSSVLRNPAYVPEPLPFTERLPWLIYLVLAGSSLALGWILLSLARTTLRTAPKETNEAGGIS
jgi:Protein of unknown function (DUF3999)